MDDCEGDPALFASIATSLRQTASLLDLRFKYLKVVPWNFAHADSRDGAALFLAGATSRPLAQQDALTQYLYSTHRDALEVVVAGGICPPLLLEEVSVVNETPLDESAGEGYHRSTHLTRVRARACKTPYIKMSTRLNQNMDQLKSFLRKGEAGKRVIRYEWRRWSRVLQVKRRSLWRKRHWPASKVFERVYRMDAFSDEDWSSVVVSIPAPGQGKDPRGESAAAAVSGSQLEACRIEYLLDVLKPPEWYQVQVPVTAQNDHGDVEERLEPRRFQLLHMTSSKSRPKLMPTIQSWEDPALHKRLALHIQESSLIPLPDKGAGDGSVVVYPDADPRWVSYEDIGPWDAFKSSLTRFQIVQGIPEHRGCLRLSDPELARTIHPITDLKCPTLCLMSELYRLGWTPAKHTVEHNSVVCGEFDSREAVRMKTYYMVLLQIRRCMPLSSRIPSNQPIGYYRLLLEGRSVEPYLGQPEYQRLLKGGTAIAPAIEDDEEVSLYYKRKSSTQS